MSNEYDTAGAPDSPDPDLATRFAAASRPTTMAAVESDLAAVHQRSRSVQRRRVLGGTAAAGLLVVGVGALVVTQDTEEPATAVSAAAGVDEPGTGMPDDTGTTLPPTDDAAPEPADGEPTDEADSDPTVDAPTDPGTGATGEVGTGPGDADANDASPFDDLPLDLPAIDDFPVPDLPPLPESAADGSTDWSAYVDQLSRSLEVWVNELGVWLEANPEVTTWIELNGPFGPLDAVIAEEEIADWLKEFDLDEWKTELDQLEFDLDEWMGQIDVDQWKTEFDVGEFDLDTWLDGLDVEEWKTDLEVDRWLEDLGIDGTAAFPLPDLEQLDLDQLDLGSIFPGLDDLDVTALEELDIAILDEIEFPVDADQVKDLFDRITGDG